MDLPCKGLGPYGRTDKGGKWSKEEQKAEPLENSEAAERAVEQSWMIVKASAVNPLFIKSYFPHRYISVPSANAAALGADVTTLWFLLLPKENQVPFTHT